MSCIVCIPYHEGDLKVESFYLKHYTIKKNSRIDLDFLNKDSWKPLVLITHFVNSTENIIMLQSKETENLR